MRNRTVGVAGEVAKNVELRRCEPNLLAAGDHPAFVEIDFEAGNGYFVRCLVSGEARAAEGGPNAGEEFVEAERLGEVIIGAGIESFNFVSLRIANRDDDDGNIPARAHGAAGFNSPHAGHIQIENHDIDRLLAQNIESLFAILRFEDTSALSAEAGTQHTADLWFVINKQYGAVLNHGLIRISPAGAMVTMGRRKRKAGPSISWSSQSAPP